VTARDWQSGSVAILVLWGVALIFILLAPVAFGTGTELRMTENSLAYARARHTAEAGTQLGLARLLHRQQDGAGVFDGTPEAWRQGSATIRIAIADEAGKIDLNVAPFDLIAGLFAAAGRSPAEALLLACNVLGRRGEAGAGCPEPDDNGPPAPQRVRRFTVPEELAQIPGIDPTLYDRIADGVTVATGASAIDPLVAPRLVLLAVPGATESIVDAFLESRATWRRSIPDGGSLAQLAASPYLMRSPGRDFTISAIATAEQAGYRADLQVRLTGQAARPYEVIAWRTPPVDRGK
jgi:general secretion pathway protein K